MMPHARIVCPYCAGEGTGPSVDGVCNGCSGQGSITVEHFRWSEQHRKRIERKYGRCSLPSPALPLVPC